MKQGIQSGFPHPALRASGCYFFALMKWLEVKNGMDFTDGDLIRIYETAGRKGMLNPNNAFINDAAAVLNLALGKNAYRDVRRDLREPPADGTAIRRLVRNNGRETHFTVQISGVEWDSLDPARPAAKTWAFDSFRVPL